MPEETQRRLAPSVGQISVLVVGVLTLVGLISFAVRSQAVTSAQVVKTAHDLPAYSIITPADIMTATDTVPQDALADPSEVVGRLTAHFLRQGMVLTRTMLISPTQSLQGWWLITVPVSATLSLTPGETVVLLGVQESESGSHFVYDRAIALDIKDGQAVIAMPRDQAEKAAAFLLGERRLVVLRRLSP